MEVTAKGGGSKGHNNDKIHNYSVDGIDKNVVLNIPVNSNEVTSLNGMGGNQLNELSDPSKVKKFFAETICDYGTCGEPGRDMYISNRSVMHDMCLQTVQTLNNVVNDRATQLIDQNNHSVTPHMGTNISNWQISRNVKPKFIQEFNYHLVSLFHIVSHDVAHNADTWYCYIHDHPSGSLGGFHLLKISHINGQIHVFQCVAQHNAPLYVQGTLLLCIQPVVTVHQYTHQGLLDARRAFDNYKRDQFTQHTFGVDYECYMDQVIGSLIECQDNYQCDITETIHGLSQHMNDKTENVVRMPTAGTKCLGIVNSPSCRDVNYPDKVRGYIALESTSFQFIGPDRASINTDCSDHYLNVARTIKQSGLPNYKQVRIPLNSGLCIDSWKEYLRQYKDQKLVQYLQFGYPLSISHPELLSNQSVTNHFSALQYREAVSLFLAKERSHGAILGPIENFDQHSSNKFVHCSPILTRPKGPNKRRVILDLSYPKGLALNDQVDRSRFDGDQFLLKFPSIDDIVQEICSHKDDVVISKIDVARAFRNLRVDPADALKLGITWENDVYIDVAVAFGWVHGSTAFQRVSDAVTYIMAQDGIKLFAYIDDYIMISPKSSSDTEFQRLASLLVELGLPSNPDKQTPPPCRKLTCLGIQIDMTKMNLALIQISLRVYMANV